MENAAKLAGVTIVPAFGLGLKIRAYPQHCRKTWTATTMVEFLAYLLKYRRRAPMLSRAWCVLWAKRLVNTIGLVGILFRRAALALRGAEIGRLSVVGQIELNGPARNLTIGRECVLGNKIHLAIHDRIVIKNNVIISDGCVLLTASHDVNSPDWRGVRAPIVLEDYAWIATNSMILPGVTIGYAAVVGAGSVVTKDVLPFQVVAGNPARLVAEREHRDFVYSTVKFLAPIEAWLGIDHQKPNLPNSRDPL